MEKLKNRRVKPQDVVVVLFTDARMDRASVPQNLFCYDIRHDDYCQEEACTANPNVNKESVGLEILDITFLLFIDV